MVQGESATFADILSTTGDGDRLQIIYVDARLDPIESIELDDIHIQGRVLRPLVGHFKINGTDQEFLFMVNHLYRSREDGRHEQARLLKEWAEKQTLTP